MNYCCSFLYGGFGTVVYGIPICVTATASVLTMTLWPQGSSNAATIAYTAVFSYLSSGIVEVH